MSWLAVGLLGGVVGLDATSFPQVMISRPLVAAGLTGAILGRPLEGLAVGLLLEVFSLGILPIGAARYPESGTGAIAGAAAYINASNGPDAFLLLLAVVFALLWERLAGASVTWLRRANERFVGEIAAAAGGSGGRLLETRHLGAMLLDFLRGAVVALAGAVLALGVLGLLGPLWALGDSPVLGVLVVAMATMLGAALSLFGNWEERWLSLTLGIACGLALVLLQWLV
jgi:mannose PTS system EIIC component